MDMEIDGISRHEWHEALREFRDASYFQTWDYGAVTWGEPQMSHAVLRSSGRIAALAQVRVANVLPGVRHAYLVDGPLWRQRNGEDRCEVFDEMIAGLVREYIGRQGCALKIYPFMHDGDSQADGIRDSLLRHGFVNGAERPRTLVLDIALSREELRRNLRRKWRQCLRYAEEGGLTVTVGADRELFERCLDVDRELYERKKFNRSVRMEDFLAVHERLPEPDKMTIVAVGKNDRIDACVVSTAIGDTGFPVLAATSAAGLENYASYLAYWETITRLSAKGVHWFDFRGIDPEGNRGVYLFKTGMSGDHGREVRFLGDFVRFHGPVSRLLLGAAEQGRSTYRSLAAKLQRSA